MQEVSGSSPLSSTQLRSIIRTDRTGQYSSKVPQRRPDGPPYVCSDWRRAARAGCWQDRGFQSLLRCLQACHLGRFSLLGICDTCRLAAARLVRPVSRAVTVAVVAGGLRARAPASQFHSRSPRRSYRGAGSWIAPMGLGRRAGWRRRAGALRRPGAGLRRGAFWRSHPARAAAPGGDRRAGVDWPDHAATASSPTPGITRSWSRRAPAWLRRHVRPRRLQRGQTGQGPASAASRSRRIRTVIATVPLPGQQAHISLRWRPDSGVIGERGSRLHDQVRRRY